jgi:hypothetical protein
MNEFFLILLKICIFAAAFPAPWQALFGYFTIKFNTSLRLVGTLHANITFAMSELRPILQKTIDAFVNNNTQAVKKKDHALFSEALAEKCIRLYRPLSFVNRYPEFFKKEITNAEYESQMKVELLTMQDVAQDVTRTVIDTEQRRATLLIEKTVFTVDGGKHTVEVVLDLGFTEDGTKVTEIVEFVDTFESTKVLEQILSRAAAAGN